MLQLWQPFITTLLQYIILQVASECRLRAVCLAQLQQENIDIKLLNYTAFTTFQIFFLLNVTVFNHYLHTRFSHKEPIWFLITSWKDASNCMCLLIKNCPQQWKAMPIYACCCDALIFAHICGLFLGVEISNGDKRCLFSVSVTPWCCNLYMFEKNSWAALLHRIMLHTRGH